MTTNARILRSLSIASRSPVWRPKPAGSTSVSDFALPTFSVETSSGGTRSDHVWYAGGFGEAFGWLSLLHESKHKTGRANNRERVVRRYLTITSNLAVKPD